MTPVRVDRGAARPGRAAGARRSGRAGRYRLATAAREHWPFLVALALGALVRVVVSLAFRPAILMSDGPSYLAFVDDLRPNTDRPDGYGLLLLVPLSWFSRSVGAVATTQHVLGLLTAVLLYALLRRWGVGRVLAAAATLPVLLDTLQLVLEHAVLSDPLFVLLLVAGFTVLGWRRRPSLRQALVAGLLLGVSVTVRQVGMPLLLAGVAYCLLVGRGWRGRALPALVLAVGLLAPVAAYASWYHAEHGVYALSQVGGRSAYMRTTTFVDCSTLSVPAYQRVLCPPEPLGERLDPTQYGWHSEERLARLDPPAGTSQEEAMASFAHAAMRSQPLDYALVVARDLALNFDVYRGNRFEYDTAWKWRFSSYVDRQPTPWTQPAFAAHGGEQQSTHQPWADALAAYQWVGYLPGPLLAGCLVLGLVAGAGVGRARRSGARAMCLLLTVSGAGLMLVPAITTQFVWRYQLPAVVLLPAGAALAIAALRGRARPPRVR